MHRLAIPLVVVSLAVAIGASSPGAHSLAFASKRGYDALYVADASGGHLRRITAEPTLNPAWKA